MEPCLWPGLVERLKLEGQRLRDLHMSVSIDGGEDFLENGQFQKPLRGLLLLWDARLCRPAGWGSHALQRAWGTSRPMVHLHSTDRGKTFAYRLLIPGISRPVP